MLIFVRKAVYEVNDTIIFFVKNIKLRKGATQCPTYILEEIEENPK